MLDLLEVLKQKQECQKGEGVSTTESEQAMGKDYWLPTVCKSEH